MSLTTHTHVYEPAKAGSARTLLMLHGTGGDERDLLPLARMLDADAAVLSPRGNVLERGMARFFARLSEGVFDEADLIRRTGELADWVQVATTHYGRDAAHMTAVGFSNGANVAAAMLLLRPGVLRAAILIRAMVPIEKGLAPGATVLGERAPVRGLVLAGMHDPIVTAANSRRLAGLLTSRGVDTTLAELAAGHELTREDVVRGREWLGAA